MASGLLRRISLFIALTVVSTYVFSQGNVPLGIHYQAVARDNFGSELVNKKISVKFSIISGDPLSAPVYQELHQDVTTSKFGVFSIVIGHGVATGNSPSATLADIAWGSANHYLKVEVKFGNDFMDMGTMQFLAVPYALYAQKSLEPGPTGPKGDQGAKGDPGDPASDNQTLSFDESNLTISGGNSVPLTSLLQNLTVSNAPDGYYLGISRGNSVKLATIEADGDPNNERQDLSIVSDVLKITNNPQATSLPLSDYRQTLTWDKDARILGISGTSSQVTLSELKNDADADPGNEIQDLIQIGDSLKLSKNTYSKGVSLAKYLDDTDKQGLTYDEATNSLTIDRGNTVSLSSMVAFRATKTTSETKSSYMTDYDFVANIEEYDESLSYNNTTGIFTAPLNGIYTFNIGYTATGVGDSRILKIYLNGSQFEILNSGITGGLTLLRSITMKLVSGDKVKPIINVGTGFETGIGSFSGFKVN